MKGNKLRVVVIYDQVQGTDKHCDNICQHMAHPQAMSKLAMARCDLFDVGLEWDKRKKAHGYKRTERCINAEDAADELVL